MINCECKVKEGISTITEFTFDKTPVTLTKKKDPESGNFYFGFISTGRASEGIVDELKYAVPVIKTCPPSLYTACL